MPTEPRKPLIVISYAHADEPEHPAEGEVKWLSFVTDYLGPAVKHGAVDLWIDRLMPGGADWEREIEQKLRACDIFILLVSPHSLASDYVVDQEIPIIRERQAKGEAVHFYPLILTPTPEAGLDLVRDKNLRPTDGKPLSDYPLNERYRHMNEAANEIASIAAKIEAQSKLETPVSQPEALPAGHAASPQPAAEEVNLAIGEIEDRESLERWLRKQPRETAVTIAARAALRVVPFVGSATEQIFQLTEASFRAIAMSRAAGKYPARVYELHAYAARVAVGAASDAAADAFNSAAGTREKAAVLAADSAVFAAAAVYEGYVAPFADAVYAARSAALAADFAAQTAASAADAAPFAADDASAALWAEVRADADVVSRNGAAALADRPLWSQGSPDWAGDRWAKLQAALPKGEDWDVWINWYEERLRSVSRDEAYDLAFATVPTAQWDRGPAAENAWIKAHLPKSQEP